jgi:hypothetical protein
MAFLIWFASVSAGIQIAFGVFAFGFLHLVF